MPLNNTQAEVVEMEVPLKTRRVAMEEQTATALSS